MLVIWSLIATGAAYTLLAGWRFSIGTGGNREPTLVAAFVGVGLWALLSLSLSPALMIVGEFVQQLGWLAYLANATRHAPEQTRRVWHKWEATLAAVASCTALAALIVRTHAVPTPSEVPWIVAALVGHLVFLIGGIIYLHNLHSDLSSRGRTGVRLIITILAVLWAYDLNAYTVELLGSVQLALTLFAGKALIALLLLPGFAIAARRREQWKIALSRKVTFQSLSLFAIGFYLVGMSVSARAIMLFSDAAAPVLGLLLTSVLSVAGAIFILIPNARARVKVIVTKHFFSHRYDYRTEWLRFSATIAETNAMELTLEERAVKAIADVTGSPAGLLLLAGPDQTLELTTVWRWRDLLTDTEAAVKLSESFTRSMEDGLIVTLPPDGLVLETTMGTNDAWVAVPLISLSALVGVVVLAKPQISRHLDWEDFDLLKVLGRQIAVHLSDAHKQSELEEARRFEEFNRRFSYIIHDVKNVVSQLSLLASNAEQHGANPRFQADMTRSLTNAVDKMTVLLSRLAPERVFQTPIATSFDVAHLLEAVSAGYSVPVSIEVPGGMRAVGVPDRLKLAIEHLVQNAIEASPRNEPVILTARPEGERCFISVTDHGSGMSGDFIRKGLFKPFVSTKGGGFGIGAAEAKALIEGMGGKLRVSSTEGRGSVFTIDLLLSSNAR